MAILSPVNRTAQPQTPVRLADGYSHLFTSLNVMGVPAVKGFDFSAEKLSQFAKTGTVNDNFATPYGLSIKGDGSTGLYSRSVSVPAQAIWLVTTFVATTINTTQKCLYAIGSASSVTGAYVGINAGGNSFSGVTCQFRGADGGGIISISGPSLEAGKEYTVVFVAPSNSQNSAYMMVNGVFYNTLVTGSGNTTFTTTLVNEAVGALKRGTTAVYSTDPVLLTGYGLGQIPRQTARAISTNPWQIFTPQKQRLYFAEPGAPSEITGTFGATETGSDTFSATGSVLIEGALTATETGNDTFQGTGAAVSTGDLAATETGSDTFAATGGAIVSGSLTASETGDDIFQGSGAAVASGALDATETGADTFSASGTQVSTGTLSASETGTDTFSATGNVVVSGTLAVSETGSDTFVGVGGNVTTGALNATETGSDTFASTGSVIVSGTLSVTEGSDTFSAIGNVIVSGALAVSETEQDTFSSAGGAVIAGTFAATETGADTFSAAGTFVSTGALSATEQSDTFSASGNLVVNGTLATTEQPDVFSATGSVIISGALSVSEIGLDTFLAYDSGSAPTSAIADTQWSLIIKEYRKISAVKNTDFRAVVK